MYLLEAAQFEGVTATDSATPTVDANNITVSDEDLGSLYSVLQSAVLAAEGVEADTAADDANATATSHLAALQQLAPRLVAALAAAADAQEAAPTAHSEEAAADATTTTSHATRRLRHELLLARMASRAHARQAAGYRALLRSVCGDERSAPVEEAISAAELRLAMEQRLQRHAATLQRTLVRDEAQSAAQEQASIAFPTARSADRKGEALGDGVAVLQQWWQESVTPWLARVDALSRCVDQTHTHTCIAHSSFSCSEAATELESQHRALEHKVQNVHLALQSQQEASNQLQLRLLDRERELQRMAVWRAPVCVSAALRLSVAL